MSSKIRGAALAAALFAASGNGLAARGEARPATAPLAPAATPAEDLQFLHDLARDVVQASRVPPGKKAGGSPTNTCGFTLIMPDGRAAYHAFWLQDFAMSLDSGFITSEETLQHLRLIARSQNGPVARKLQHGLIVPPFAVPDHINFDGGAVFYPGTYSSGDDQGNGNYGILPQVDNHYEFVHVAWWLWRVTGRAEFLQESINGLTLFERLKAGFAAPRSDAQTGLVATDTEQRAVGFGFCDGICLTGELLFPSLLRYRAAGELADLCRAAGKDGQEPAYRQVQQRIAGNLAAAFAEPDRVGGWLLAATSSGRQPDVWGTLYAVHLGIIQGGVGQSAIQTVAEAVRKGTIVLEGGVRHVPTNFDWSATSAWEKTAGLPLNTYQNGAYWHTPTGWIIAVVRRQDAGLASQLFRDYIRHLRADDFRRGPGHGAPWECFGPKGYAQNGVYMTSVTLPAAVLGAKPGAGVSHQGSP
jgi:hypothetical protein